MNEKLSNLETGMEKISKDRAESSCAIQSKLDALLRNSLAQDKSVTDKQPGTRVDFVEPQRKKRESTPLPRTDNNIAPGVTRTAMKGGASNSMETPGETSAHTGVPTDAMKWASTWNTMDRTLEAFATRNTIQVTEEVVNPEKPSRNRMNSKRIQMVALTPWLR